MAHASHFSNSRGSLFAPLTAWVHTMREQVSRYRSYRRTCNELSSLSGRQLADLGLNRTSLRTTAYRVTYHPAR